VDRRHIGAIVWSVDRMRIGTIGWSTDRMHIGTIVRSVGDSRRIGAIGWSMYRMYIGTIIVCIGSSTVPAIGSFGWQYNASNGVVFVGVLARILVLVYTFQHWQFFLCA